MKDRNQDYADLRDLRDLKNFLSSSAPAKGPLPDSVSGVILEKLQELETHVTSAPVYHSFTETLCDYASGRITDLMLYRCGGLRFNCHREHLFPTAATIEDLGETLPMEITWVNIPEVPKCEHPMYGPITGFVDTSRVPASIVPDSLQLQFSQFVAIVAQLDSIGLVSFHSDRCPLPVEDERQMTKRDCARFHAHWSHDMGPLS